MVFVGYSIGDPVMSYMVDALAAERAKGARFAVAYAFADMNGFDGAKGQDSWRAKNVEPILYDGRDGHRILSDTLIEWASIRRDPFRARSQIAINELTKMPDDTIASRVVWALEDPVAAEALADAPPVRDETEFKKLEQWLNVFAERKLICCSFGDVAASISDQSSLLACLVGDSFQQRNPNNLDMIRVHLSVWLARHLHVPQLVSWVLRNGGHLHPQFQRDIRRELAADDADIPERLRLLWTVILNHSRPDPWSGLWTANHYSAAASNLERHRIEDEVIRSIAPRLCVHLGLPPWPFRRDSQESASPIDSCGHLKLVVGEEENWDHVRDIFQNRQVIARYAETLTEYLELALLLGEEDPRVSSLSNLYRPSIAEHKQNSYLYEWIRLIDLIRDSYFELALKDRQRAENLLLRWVASRRSLFKRLALHALTENSKSNILLVRDLLVRGRKPGIWEHELHREVMRFFRLAGKRLPLSLRTEILSMIDVGPRTIKGWKSSGGLDRIRQLQALLLYKLSLSGIKLNKMRRDLAVEAESRQGVDRERDEFLFWHGPLQVGDYTGPVSKQLIKGSIADIVEALRIDGQVEAADFQKLALSKQEKVAAALRRIGKQGEWPITYWSIFLGHLMGLFNQSRRSTRLHNYVAAVLTVAPNEVFAKLRLEVTNYIIRLAKEYSIELESKFELFWARAWPAKGVVEQVALHSDDPVREALNRPSGRLAEAAYARLRKYEPKTGTGLPRAVRLYFDQIGKSEEWALWPDNIGYSAPLPLFDRP